MIESAVWVGGTLTLAYPLAAWHWYGYRTWTTTTGTIGLLILAIGLMAEG